MTITEFLLARIAEDEEVALAAAGWNPAGTDRSDGQWIRVGMASVENSYSGSSVIYSDNGQTSAEVADHVARHDPARALAECKAKRAILACHEGCDDCAYGLDDLCMQICALASAYADHPDFLAEWVS